MKKIGIFYGSSTGVTAKIARQLATLLNVSQNDVHDIADIAPSALGEYEIILLGSSTWGAGEMQKDWMDFSKALEAMDLKGKTIAVFGTGNEKMAVTFCNAVGRIYDIAAKTGAKMIGEFNSDGYTFRKSLAKIEDSDLMKGLVIDQGNEPRLTDKRLEEWTKIILKDAE